VKQREFKPVGKVSWAHRVSEPPFKLKATRNPRFRAGIRYEEEALEYLYHRLGSGFGQKLWFCYQAEYRPYPCYCQVDALFDPGEDEGDLTLFEVKYRHTPDTYFQLTNIYLPVLRAAYPSRRIAVCEVVRWFDPGTAFPVPVVLAPDPGAVRLNDFSVHIFNSPVRKKIR
jgi:hypothetical protein